MKLSVKNFGPIGDAKDIRVSPMTMFVGPSNTGKSYLAVLLYAIVETLSEVRANPKAKDVPKSTDAVSKWMSEPKVPAPVPVQRWFGALSQAMFNAWAYDLGEMWRNKVLYFFGEEGETLLQEKGMSVILSSEDGAVSVDLLSPKMSHIDDRVSAEVKKYFIGEFQEQKHLWLNFPKLGKSSPFLINIRGALFSRRFRYALWPDASDDAHYLPAIRGGIMQSHRGLVDAVMKQAPLAGLERSPFGGMINMPMFTGVLSDFMRKLISLDGNEIFDGKFNISPDLRIVRRKPNAAIVAIGKRLEGDIMKGEIEIKKSETGYPDFRYKFSSGKRGRTLSLKNTSSMVSELAPVSVFVRHHLDNGDLFIVEEPEAHLHPDGQRAISDILVQLANAGVFVLATTHSDIVLEQIGNAVRRAGQKGKKTGAKNGGVSLDKDKTSAYSFGSRVKGKTEIKKVEFDSTDGFMTDDHLRASADLYNDTVGLMDGEGDD